jgi:hypothetical protein
MRRVLLLGTAALLSFLALWVAPAAAQLPTTITISDSRGEVAELLRRGHQLELERRWGDALSHYEEGLRRHPNDASLQQRFDFARLHYDVQRRYNDRSFAEAVSRSQHFCHDRQSQPLQRLTPWNSRPAVARDRQTPA